MKKNGFTLVELLIVIVVLSTAGILVLTIFTNSLRGGNRAQISSAIQKNGRNVLDMLDKTIRNSDNLVCMTGGVILVVVKDGIYTRYKFIPQTTSANGKIVVDYPLPSGTWTDPGTGTVYNLDYLPDFKNKICAEADPNPDPNNRIALTDTDPETGVSITVPAGGMFSNPNQSAGFKNQVKIEFFVGPGVSISPVLSGQVDAVNFVTTVNLR